MREAASILGAILVATQTFVIFNPICGGFMIQFDEEGIFFKWVGSTTNLVGCGFHSRKNIDIT